MNYYENSLPFDKNAEYNLNQLEGRHSSDDTVRTIYGYGYGIG